MKTKKNIYQGLMLDYENKNTETRIKSVLHLKHGTDVLYGNVRFNENKKDKKDFLVEKSNFVINNLLKRFKFGFPLEAGYIYAPYVPMQMTPIMVGRDDLCMEEGFLEKNKDRILSRYAQRTIVASRYGTLNINNGNND